MVPNSTDVDILGPWAWKLMGAECWTPVGRSAMGYVNDAGEVLWAAIYDHFEQGSVQVHLAVDNPKIVTRQAIREVFEYPFYQLRVKKLIGVVNSENTRALTFDLRLGFHVEAVIEDAYDRGDMYILSMTQEQCRWLRGKSNGFSNESAAAA